MSYGGNSHDDGLTALERASGVWNLLYGRCSCNECDDCLKYKSDRVDLLKKRQREIENSERFKQATKIIAGLYNNKQIKEALIKKIHQESLDYAMIRYMQKESLPSYYSSILKSTSCIETIIAGILYKVCKIRKTEMLDDEIRKLVDSLYKNDDLLIAYDRVTKIQQFIHKTTEQYLGKEYPRLIPIEPMKNALSAARLHLSIRDTIDRGAAYVMHIDRLTKAAQKLELEQPRPSTAPLGKASWKKWRVRHLRSISYFFPNRKVRFIKLLENLDERMTIEEFTEIALHIYARQDEF